MAAERAPTLDEALSVLESLAREAPAPVPAVEGARLTAALASDMLITTVEEAGAAAHRCASDAASSSAEAIAEAMDACLELTSPDHGHLAAAAALAVAALCSSAPERDASDPPVPQMWSPIAIAASTVRGHLGIDAALTLAAVWPAVRLCQSVELSVGLGERASTALDSAVGALWTALWVAGAVSGPAAAVAGAVKRIGRTLDEGEEELADLCSQDIVASDAAERLEEAAAALGCASWIAEPGAVGFPDRLHADTLGKGLWLADRPAAAVPAGGAGGGGGGSPAPAAAQAAAGGAPTGAAAAAAAPSPGSEKAEAALFGRAKALGAVGAGAGFVPPRFGPPPPANPLATAPSDAMWAPILGGRCPVSSLSLVELVSRRQDVGSWEWPKATADDAAAAELLRPLVDAHTVKPGAGDGSAAVDAGTTSGTAWHE
ncbi:hypothetical protein FNF28_02592 [Cafeteria roenbergensis]|uniref:Uncharacterized protein n=1 Tax=Cafeteria roenbergensis TaxID=33653 RepID=A0A5A8DRZ4_CAFRO|nr:hypothetical protein FNF28_02592 [Cafeteria roenbergensis]